MEIQPDMRVIRKIKAVMKHPTSKGDFMFLEKEKLGPCYLITGVTLKLLPKTHEGIFVVSALELRYSNHNFSQQYQNHISSKTQNNFNKFQ